MRSIYGSTPKFVDTADTLTVTASDPIGADSTNTVTGVNVESGPSGRTNMCIAVTSIYCKFHALLPAYQDVSITPANANLALLHCHWQMAIILDKQPNKAVLTPALIFALTSAFQSPLNLDNRKRIKILFRTSGRLDPGASSAFCASSVADELLLARPLVGQQRKVYLKLKKPIQVEFDAQSTTGLITDTMENAISVWFWTEDYNATYHIPAMYHYTRIRYHDCT